MKEKELIEIGAAVIAGLVLFILLRHQAQTGTPLAVMNSPLVPPSSPNDYLTYNQPSMNSGAQNNIPTVTPATLGPAAQTNAPCACSSSPVQYASLNAFAGTLAAMENTVIEAYQNSILAAIPSWLGEFINNTYAPEASAAASGAFSGMAGGR